MAVAPMTIPNQQIATPALRVLVGDDQPAVLEAVRLLLKGEGHAVAMAANPAAVLQLARQEQFDLILIDLNYARDTTSGQEGLDLLASLRDASVDAPVVVMTAWGTVEIAVEAMRRGARDFVQKPWDNSTLLKTICTYAQEGATRNSINKRARTELEIARTVQQKLLPGSAPSLRTLDCGAICFPAGAVGGDLYDYLPMASSQLGVLLADVSGKGVGAALLMAHLQSSFRTLVASDRGGVNNIAAQANRLFFDATPPEQYATVFFGAYDDRTRILSYVNAGHTPPVLLRSSGEIEHLSSTATVLGMFGEWQSKLASVEIRTGDVLVIFSDGLEDVEERVLLDEVRLTQGSPAIQTACAVARLGTGDAQMDDITVVALRGL